MANVDLQGKTWPVPVPLQKVVQDQNITYALLKKYKHFFDHNGSEHPEFYKWGGAPMKAFVENTLRASRDEVDQLKRNKMRIGMDNQFKSPHSKDKSQPVATDKLTGGDDLETSASRFFENLDMKLIIETFKRINNR